MSGARFVRFSVLAALTMSACTGSIEARPGAREPGDVVDEDAGGTSGSGGRPGPLAAATCPPRGSVNPGPAPLRRLSRDEYNATIADLLGDLSRPGDVFPPDERRFCGGHLERQVVDEGLELLVAGDKVRFTIHFDEHADHGR